MDPAGKTVGFISSLFRQAYNAITLASFLSLLPRTISIDLLISSAGTIAKLSFSPFKKIHRGKEYLPVSSKQKNRFPFLSGNSFQITCNSFENPAGLFDTIK